MANCVLIIVQLMIVVLIRLSYQQNEIDCRCDTAHNSDDRKVLEDIEDMINRRIDNDEFKDNEQYCFKYKLFRNSSNDLVTVISKMNSPSTPLPIVSGQYRRFITPHYNLGQCYPSQIFCIAKVKCNDTDIAWPIQAVEVGGADQESSIELTRNDDDDTCTDSIKMMSMNYEPQMSPEFCGTKRLPDPTSPSQSLYVQFFSSFCCENCGSYLLLQCVNQNQGQAGAVGQTFKRMYKKLFLDVWNKQMLYHVRRIIIINLGLTYRANTIKYSFERSRTYSHKISGIYKLFTFDEDTKCYNVFERESSESYSSGILYIGFYVAWFIITDKELPIERRTLEEQNYVNDALEFTKVTYNQDPDIIKIDKKELNNLIDLNIYNEYRPRCAARRPFHNPNYHIYSPKNCSIKDCPTADEQFEILDRSLRIAATSTDVQAKAFANLIIDTLAPKPRYNKKYPPWERVGEPGRRRWPFPRNGRFKGAPGRKPFPPNKRVKGVPGQPGTRPPRPPTSCPVLI